MPTWNPEEYYKHSANQQNWARQVIAKLVLFGNETVLDIGCGDGKVTAELSKRVPLGTVLGVDRSPEMVRFAQQWYQTSDYPNLTFEVADALSLPFENRFDLVVSFTCLHWVQDHSEVLRGIHRVLRPGGRIFLQFGGKGTGKPIFRMFQEVLHREAWRPYFKDFPLPWFFYDVEAYRPWVAASGLRERRLELLPYEGTFTREGLMGWIRSTWIPYLERLPASLREPFIHDMAEAYLLQHPLNEQGVVRLPFIRLELVAEKS